MQGCPTCQGGMAQAAEGEPTAAALREMVRLFEAGGATAWTIRNIGHGVQAALQSQLLPACKRGHVK